MPDVPQEDLAAALEANFAGRFGLLRFWPRATVHDSDGIFWDLTSLPMPFFNNVVRARLTGESAGAVVEAAITRCRQAGVPMNWWVGPASRPGNLPAILEAHGFRRTAADRAMWAGLRELDAAAAGPPRLVVERLSDAADLGPWCDVLAECFGYPEAARDPFIEATAASLRGAAGAMRCYLGKLDGRPVATCFMVLAAGVAGIHGVGTLAPLRRQGMGTAMTLAALRDALNLGYKVGVLRASALGIGVYRRLGFRDCGAMEIYTWRPPAA